MASRISHLLIQKNIYSKEKILYIETKKGEYRGYKQNLLIENLTEVESEFYVCRKCNGLMRNACQIGPEQIPVCEKCAGITTTHTTIKIRKRISELGAKCPLEKRGCEWKGTINTVNTHLDMCLEFKVNCTNKKCEVIMKRSELINHCNNECQNRKTNCKHCRVIVVFKDIDTHNKTCNEFPVLCPNQCEKSILRKQIELHTKNECPNTIVECPYRMTGCKERMKRKETEDHENKFETKHLRESVTYFLSKLELMEKKLKDSESKNELLKQENKRQSKEFAEKLKQCECELKESTKKLTAIESEFVSKENYNRYTESLAYTNSKLTSNNEILETSVKSIDDKVRELSKDALYQTVVSDEIGKGLIAYSINTARPTYLDEITKSQKFEFRWNQLKLSLIFNYVRTLQQFFATIRNDTELKPFLKKHKIKAKLTILDTKFFHKSLVFVSKILELKPIGQMGNEFKLAEIFRDQMCEERLRNTKNTISFMLQMQEVDV